MGPSFRSLSPHVRASPFLWSGVAGQDPYPSSSWNLMFTTFYRCAILNVWHTSGTKNVIHHDLCSSLIISIILSIILLMNMSRDHAPNSARRTSSLVSLAPNRLISSQLWYLLMYSLNTCVLEGSRGTKISHPYLVPSENVKSQVDSQGPKNPLIMITNRCQEEDNTTPLPGPLIFIPAAGKHDRQFDALCMCFEASE